MQGTKMTQHFVVYKMNCCSSSLKERMIWDMCKLNKEKFLKTELGGNLYECIKAWDEALSDVQKRFFGTDEYKRARKTASWCQAQWEVYKMTIKQFYGIEYNFTRTDEYYGLTTEDERDWLIKMERK